MLAILLVALTSSGPGNQGCALRVAGSRPWRRVQALDVEDDFTAAALFHRRHGEWVLRLEVVEASGQRFELQAVDAPLSAVFVDVATDPGVVVLGVPLQREGCTSVGAHVFLRESDGWVERQRIGVEREYQTGYARSVALERGLLVVGDAYREPNGGVDLHRLRNGRFELEADLAYEGEGRIYDGFGNEVATDGETVLVSDSGHDAQTERPKGAVHVFERREGSWARTDVWTAPRGDRLAWFGQRIAVRGDVALVASSGVRDDAKEFVDWTVFVYRRTGGEWKLETELRPPRTQERHSFGAGLAVGDGWVAVGAFGDDAFAEHAGTVFVYTWDGLAWGFVRRLDRDPPATSFGHRIASTAHTLVVGASDTTEEGKFELVSRFSLP